MNYTLEINRVKLFVSIKIVDWRENCKHKECYFCKSRSKFI